MPIPCSDLDAYDILPPILRHEVAASHWPLPCHPLAQVVAQRGMNAALRKMREWERQFAADHEITTRRACQR
jgi:hypothetical protein